MVDANQCRGNIKFCGTNTQIFLLLRYTNPSNSSISNLLIAKIQLWCKKKNDTPENVNYNFNRNTIK